MEGFLGGVLATSSASGYSCCRHTAASFFRFFGAIPTPLPTCAEALRAGAALGTSRNLGNSARRKRFYENTSDRWKYSRRAGSTARPTTSHSR